jgi:hypothetical protein
MAGRFVTMTEPVVLAPPGAGLPAAERSFARWALGLARCALSRGRIERWLRAETMKVLGAAAAFSDEQLRRPVLVPRPLGLEDSSRNWSAAMVLRHLVIVDTGIADVIEALADRQVFERDVRIPDVKPDPGVGREQVAQLEAALARYVKCVGAITDLHTAATHEHPWFGPLNGHGWHALAAVHTLIHRRQLEAILRRLPTPAPAAGAQR